MNQEVETKFVPIEEFFNSHATFEKQVYNCFKKLRENSGFLDIECTKSHDHDIPFNTSRVLSRLSECGLAFPVPVS